MMGSGQQLAWNKVMNFPANGCDGYGMKPQVKVCRASYVEGSLVSGRQSTLSVSVPEIGGNNTTSVPKYKITFPNLIRLRMPVKLVIIT